MFRGKGRSARIKPLPTYAVGECSVCSAQWNQLSSTAKLGLESPPKLAPPAPHRTGLDPSAHRASAPNSQQRFSVSKFAPGATKGKIVNSK
ncbi:hypothetical protein BDY21DRAFT_350024 [Lineolata rhizophorae]|uniref:Uncharacterized protein n=1 Tax=Lineolata rhizophorae TaxID=578093 RepID=A0A6A6NV65_9PEZI|nr:hypothetical protein BDY21DRAFT_350024 [Lineolata rhizophorae]